jgi:hypothetical protein
MSLIVRSGRTGINFEMLLISFYFSSRRTPQAVKHQMLRRKCLAPWQAQEPSVQATLGAALTTSHRQLASWYSDAAMSGRRIRFCFGSTPVALHSLSSKREGRLKSEKNLNQRTSRRGRKVGKKAIMLNFPWRSERYRKTTLE